MILAPSALPTMHQERVLVGQPDMHQERVLVGLPDTHQERVLVGQPDTHQERVLGSLPDTHQEPGTEGVLRETERQLAEYFAGVRQVFEVDLAPEGTTLSQLVWRALLQIPYGQTTTYSALATKLGKPNAARAIARACATNPLPLVIPCHRVIGADGALRGFLGGLEAKRWLLAHEAQTVGANRARDAALL